MTTNHTTLTLTDTELQVVRTALVREMALAWSNRNDGPYWEQVRDTADRLIVRIDGLEAQTV